MSDFTVKDGKIVGRMPAAFEQGEQWVKCNHCGTTRPANDLQPWYPVKDDTTKVVAICKDEDWCDEQYGKTRETHEPI